MGKTVPRHLFLAALLTGAPAAAWDTLVFANERPEACTLTAPWLPYRTTFTTIDRHGRETAQAIHAAGLDRNRAGIAVPPFGTLRIHQEGDAYYRWTGYEVRLEGRQEPDFEASTGNGCRGRRHRFGWVSWRRLTRTGGATLERSACLGRMSFRDAPPEP